LLSLARRWTAPQQQQQQHGRFAGCLAELARDRLQPHENPAMGWMASAAANTQAIDLARAVEKYISGTVTIPANSTVSSSPQL
jgi:hypothetical protein